MTTRTKISIIILFLIFAIVELPIPVTASGNASPLSQITSLASALDPDKNDTGQSVALRELVIDDLFSFPVVQQPDGNVTFVSSLQNYVTEFQIAADFGTVGLLAHNYLAGQYFYQILPGQEIRLVYSDKSSKDFVVTEIQRYQAMAPESPSSDFIDLSTGEVLSASQVFMKTYGNRSGRLILQTCIYGEQNPSWGRLFIIAQPARQASLVD